MRVFIAFLVKKVKKPSFRVLKVYTIFIMEKENVSNLFTPETEQESLIADKVAQGWNYRGEHSSSRIEFAPRTQEQNVNTDENNLINAYGDSRTDVELIPTTDNKYLVFTKPKD